MNKYIKHRINFFTTYQLVWNNVSPFLNIQLTVRGGAGYRTQLVLSRVVQEVRQNIDIVTPLVQHMVAKHVKGTVI